MEMMSTGPSPLVDAYAEAYDELMGYTRTAAMAGRLLNGVFPVTDTRASLEAIRQNLGLETIWLTDLVVLRRP
jgi:ferric-dicitrate binding protein FerR (iron transport regulator)